MPEADRIKEELRTAYDADAERRDTLETEPWRLDVMDRWGAELSKRGHRSVLELGCGTGQLARHMADNDFNVTATDLSAGNVEATAARGIEASVADFAELRFPDKSFDAAFGFNSLLHVPPEDLEGVLIEIRRVIRRGGLLLIVVWGGINSTGPLEDDWFDPPRYFSLYTDDEFAALTAPGFSRISFETLPIIRGALHPQLLVLEAT